MIAPDGHVFHSESARSLPRSDISKAASLKCPRLSDGPISYFVHEIGNRFLAASAGPVNPITLESHKRVLRPAQNRLIPMERVPEVHRPHPLVPLLEPVAVFGQKSTTLEGAKEEQVTLSPITTIFVGKTLALAVITDRRRLGQHLLHRVEDGAALQRLGRHGLCLLYTSDAADDS